MAGLPSQVSNNMPVYNGGLNEGPVSPELDRAVKTFVTNLATKFGYDEEDAVYGILESLKRQWKDYMATVQQ